jgi:hypothetical protein
MRWFIGGTLSRDAWARPNILATQMTEGAMLSGRFIVVAGIAKMVCIFDIRAPIL